MPAQQSAVLDALTVVSTDGAHNELGAIWWIGNKAYKYVNIKNTTATVAGALGDPVGYFAVTGYGANRVVIDESDADNPPLCAGVLQGTVVGTLTVDYWGWIQIKGAATLVTAVTNGTSGAPVFLLGSTTDKTMQRANEADSAAVYKQVCGYSLNTTTGVYLDCPF